tara:strand:+ start:260 stop:502 length:243 start_codon:yes stop_codon:yes gene_type:complete
MLSRKYYKKLAEIFKNGYIESYKKVLETDPNITNNVIGSHIAEMQWELIDFLKADNPRFNEDTFLKAMDVDLEKLKKEYQ